MRKIGAVSDISQAEVLGAYLFSQGIENDIDESDDGTWAVWIHADEKNEAGREVLAKFLENPDDPEFHQGAEQGKKKLDEEEARKERWKKQYHDRSRVFKATRMGLVTAALVGFSVLLAIVTNFGKDVSMTDQLSLTSMRQEDGWMYPDKTMPEIRGGQVWRLVTPIFLHFGFIHLLFNMLWMYDLGNAMERRHGALMLIAFVLLVAIPSNLLQFLFAGPAFGGMSGVVYGLLGYFWIRGRVDPGYNLHLKKSTLLMMGVWFVICLVMPGLNIANIVHSVGLLMGIVLGYASGMLARNRRA